MVPVWLVIDVEDFDRLPSGAGRVARRTPYGGLNQHCQNDIMCMEYIKMEKVGANLDEIRSTESHFPTFLSPASKFQEYSKNKAIFIRLSVLIE